MQTKGGRGYLGEYVVPPPQALQDSFTGLGLVTGLGIAQPKRGKVAS